LLEIDRILRLKPKRILVLEERLIVKTKFMVRSSQLKGGRGVSGFSLCFPQEERNPGIFLLKYFGV
jgi:hypothetical protein